MKTTFLAALAGLSACASVQSASSLVKDAGFSFIEAAAGTIRTTNRLRFEIAYPGARLAGTTHRRDVFNGRPYEISLAALIGEDGAVIIHAERVADASGASNYDSLPASDWPEAAFRKGIAACIAIGPDDIEGEHDLEWLLSNDFDPVGEAILQQYFTTTADHNDEIVLTLMRKVSSCAAAGEPEAALGPLRARVEVKKAP